MENERLSILKMIETGRVTAEEGLRLLEALDAPRRGSDAREARPREPRYLRVVISELGTGRRRAQLNVPMSLVDLAFRLAARNANRSIHIAGQRIDPEIVLEAVHNGTVGRILDLSDDEENVKVEVFLE